ALILEARTLTPTSSLAEPTPSLLAAVSALVRWHSEPPRRTHAWAGLTMLTRSSVHGTPTAVVPKRATTYGAGTSPPSSSSPRVTLRQAFAISSRSSRNEAALDW